MHERSELLLGEHGQEPPDLVPTDVGERHVRRSVVADRGVARGLTVSDQPDTATTLVFVPAGARRRPWMTCGGHPWSSAIAIVTSARKVSPNMISTARLVF